MQTNMHALFGSLPLPNSPPSTLLGQEREKWGEKEWKFFFPLAHKEKCSYEDTQGDNQKGVFWQPDFTLGAPEL